MKFEKIQTSQNGSFDTESNPAHILKRPKVHENFQNNLFWWKGATFLSLLNGVGGVGGVGT